MLENNREKKHAYLIIAHNQFELLKILIEQLDYKYNDIYIAIDKKVKDFNYSDYENLTKYSKVEFVDRIAVNWGGYSLIQCELNLLKKALNEEYSYYHLLSGVDLPIKHIEIIYNFFEHSGGKEFVSFATDEMNSTFPTRYKYYHFFQERIKRNFILRQIEKLSIRLQKKIKINRVKNLDLEFRQGSQWFSITYELALYILSKEKEISKLYRYTSCCDEIFLQTYIFNSSFRNNLYKYEPNDFDTKTSARYIDWKRGNPYVFREKDYNSLINSPAMFARKFDYNLDLEIINRIVRYLEK